MLWWYHSCDVLTWIIKLFGMLLHVCCWIPNRRFERFLYLHIEGQAVDRIFFFHAWPWRWRHYDPSKRREVPKDTASNLTRLESSVSCCEHLQCGIIHHDCSCVCLSVQNDDSSVCVFLYKMAVVLCVCLSVQNGVSSVCVFCTKWR